MSKKVCVLGSSYIGAVYKAYKEPGSARDGYEVDFYGRAAGRFRELKIIDGYVRNARFASRADPLRVEHYDAFVIYADLPAPHEFAKVMQDCRRAGTSGQVTKALLQDIARSTGAFRLARRLAEVSGKPILILSANVPAPPKFALHEEGYDYIVSILRKAIRPYSYLPFPRALFTSDFQPDPIFYQGSLDITGDVAGTSARRDRNHMNELGGGLILDTILDAVSDAIDGQ